MMVQAKSKQQLRKRLLTLLNIDREWYKKDNELTKQIQETAKELERPKEVSQLLEGLAVDDFLYLVSENYLSEQIAWKYNLTKSQMTKWRKINGFASKKREQILEDYHEQIAEIRKKRNEY